MARCATVVLALLLLPVTAAPAAAAECPPPGGTPHPFPTDDTIAAEDPDVVLNGGGFGHGVGMSQYGAQGAATLGCSYEEILGAYFPTTTVDSLSSRSVVRVHLHRTGLEPTTIRTTAARHGGRDLDWVACPLDAAPDSSNCEVVATQPAGATWTVTPREDGRFVLADTAAGDDEPPRWEGGDLETRLRLLHDGTVVRVIEAVPSGGHDPGGMRVKWGFIEIDHTTAFDGSTYVTSYVTGDASGRSAIDTYVLGLDEVPLSWHPQALAAQAVSGRSYAEATIRSRERLADGDIAGYTRVEGTDIIQRGSVCRCDLLPTTRDQQWEGWERERLDTDGRWASAVAASADRYVLTGNGAPAITYYSSSHGDSSAAAEDIWSADLPYLQAVDTSRWEDATRSSNSLMRWTRGFDATWLASRFDVDEVASIEVVEREPGGRPAHGGVVVTGTLDGDEVTRRYGSEDIRTRLRIPSGLIRVEDGTVESDEEPSGDTDTPEEPSGEESEPSEPPEATRLAGRDRVGTAVALSQQGWETSSTVVLARADAPPDALAGSGLAGMLDAPLLVTWPDRLAEPVADEVTRLGAERAVLLGGDSALSAEVADSLADLGVAVERVAGPTRAATAAEIARRLGSTAEGTAFIVRGRFPQHPQRAWADALAVSGLAARHAAAENPWPILLANDELLPETREALSDLGITRAVLIGGTATLPEEVLVELQEMGLEVRRVSGTDRYGTSRAVASLDTGTEEVLVAATGNDFPDGLAAGPYAAHRNARLLLVPATASDDSPTWGEDGHADWIAALRWANPRLVVVGGTAAVDEDVERRLEMALFEGAGGDTSSDGG